MRIGYILAGMIFLFNPHINIIDIFPDVIGYILILHGLSKLSDLERNLLSARKKFLRLAWLSAIKFAFLVITPIFDETLYLIFTFCFGILEIMWMIPAFSDMFAGIAFLENLHTKHRTRHMAEAKLRFGGVWDKTDFEDGRIYFEIYGKTRQNADYPADEETVYLEKGAVQICAAYEGFVSRDEKKAPYYYESDEARVMSVIFIIVRAVCACLPEMTAILSTGDSYVHSYEANDYSALRYLLSAVLAVAAGIVGVVWLVRMIRYFRIFAKDTQFVSVLSDRYDAEVLPNKPLWVKRKTLSFCLFSSVALAFMTCVRLSLGQIESMGILLEAIYIVPEFLFGVMMIFAFRTVREYYPKWKDGVKKSVVFTAVSFASYIVMFVTSLRFGRMFRPYKETEYVILFVLFLALFIASMILFVRVCREKEQAYYTMVNEIGFVLSPDDHEYARKKREHMAAEFRGKIHGLYVVTIIYAIFSVVCMAVVPFGEDYVICGLSWLFRSAFCVFLIVKSVLITDKLQNEIEKVVD